MHNKAPTQKEIELDHPHLNSLVMDVMILEGGLPYSEVNRLMKQQYSATVESYVPRAIEIMDSWEVVK